MRMQITGAASSPENVTALPAASAYRVRAPATPGETAYVPSSSPQYIYDIKYYTRDTKRKVLPRKEETIDAEKLKEMQATNRKMPPAPGPGTKWTFHDMEDVPDGGYA
mmetsp:Transcript_9610/g.34079  ORF Transcript_9610/g.34079 Transcript_9610/m.34079 type:complete len:108 (+) Transcript_9610:225-548(+)